MCKGSVNINNNYSLVTLVKSGYPLALCSDTSKPIVSSSSVTLIPIVKSITLKTMNEVVNTNINASATPVI